MGLYRIIGPLVYFFPVSCFSPAKGGIKAQPLGGPGSPVPAGEISVQSDLEAWPFPHEETAVAFWKIIGCKICEEKEKGRLACVCVWGGYIRSGNRLSFSISPSSKVG